ncbi:uncharacterized protein LDX57_005621 [Aspergillus melleus]|uniref:uncharacterized protein n=1 Tax=Aspergillus melleus TaxID=138277 RepID=UPI001E8ED9E5|nr:uncharacterized protein LDX57_005621 [Aspergillus melleus]KAH8427918.1 hypothetical protein LDX57_005621 [Aspergillus melleus]
MFGKLFQIGKIFVVVVHRICTALRMLLTQQLHRLTYQAVEHPRNVFVIGASFAGYHVARCLANSLPTGYRVVVIEKHTHFHFTWILPEVCANGLVDMGDRYSATDCSGWERGGSGKVELKSGESVDYEYLVIATGASAGLPSRVPVSSKQEGMNMLEDEQEKLRVANDVVVIGGGDAGVELAADAKARYPEKNVTLVHPRQRLLNSHYGDQVGQIASRELRTLGVNVRLGERATLDAEQTQSI